MALVPVREAREGMKLLRDVTDGHGRLLLAAGDTLQVRHLDKLEKLGVSQVDVMLSDPSQAPRTSAQAPPDPALEARLDQAVAHRFRRVQQEPGMQELATIVRRYAAAFGKFA